MDLATLTERKYTLEASLKNLEQSFHMVTGHLAEVTYQISQLADNEPVMPEEPVDNEDALPVE